jgi:pimeloyl-ACP methyl ester carboxylesterase
MISGRNFRWIGAGLFTLGTVIAAALWFITGLLTGIATTIPPAARPSFQPGLLDIESASVTFDSLDGHRLAALWIDGSDPAAPTVVILHGFGASKEHMLNYILLARKAGCAALALDFRGHGDSAPSLVSYGFYEQQDALAALHWARDRRPGAPVIFWGTSMGAVTALHAAAQQPRGLSGIIADAPFDTLRNTIAHHAQLLFHLGEFPLLTLTYPRIESRAQYRIDDINSFRALAAIHVPVFFIAAENDARMPVALVRSLHDAYTGPKAFHVIAGAGHEFRSFTPEFQSVITGFLLHPPTQASP